MCQYGYNISMPKKTRRQKIIAAYRNRLRRLEFSPIKPASFNGVNEAVGKKPDFNLNKAVVSPPINLYFFPDLRKSLWLIIIIVLVEFALYFGTIRGVISF